MLTVREVEKSIAFQREKALNLQEEIETASTDIASVIDWKARCENLDEEIRRLTEKNQSLLERNAAAMKTHKVRNESVLLI